MSTAQTDMYKVQFNCTKQALEDLDDLKSKVEAPSRAETIRYAIRWLQWTAGEMRAGHKICLETDEGVREVIIPFLLNPIKSAPTS